MPSDQPLRTLHSDRGEGMFHNLITLQRQPFGLYEAIQATRTNFSEYGLESIFQGVEVRRWNLNTLGIYKVRKTERDRRQW